MSAPDYAAHCTAMAKAERDAKAAARAQRDAMAARRREVAAEGPRARIQPLKVGQSVTLPGYTKTTQLSAQLRRLYVETGARYSSALAKSPDMLTGETMIVTGVTVTRTH
jgi:hypothetical protein